MMIVPCVGVHQSSLTTSLTSFRCITASLLYCIDLSLVLTLVPSFRRFTPVLSRRYPSLDSRSPLFFAEFLQSSSVQPRFLSTYALDFLRSSSSPTQLCTRKSRYIDIGRREGCLQAKPSRNFRQLYPRLLVHWASPDYNMLFYLCLRRCTSHLVSTSNSNCRHHLPVHTRQKSAQLPPRLAKLQLRIWVCR